MANHVIVSLLINNLFAPDYRQHHIAVEVWEDELPEPQPPYARYDLTFSEFGNLLRVTKTTRSSRNGPETVTETTSGVAKVHVFKVRVAEHLDDILQRAEYLQAGQKDIITADLLRRLQTERGKPFAVTTTATKNHKPLKPTGKQHDLTAHYRREQELRAQRNREDRKRQRESNDRRYNELYPTLGFRW